MTKRLLLIFVAVVTMATTGKAQSAQFYFKGQPVTNGETVTIDQVHEDDWGDLSMATNPAGSGDQGLVLKNLTTQEVKGQATLTILSNSLGNSRIEWCMGGLCVPVQATTVNKEFSIPASGYIQAQLDVFPTQEGILEAEIRVMANLESTTVKVRFVNGPSPASPFVRRSVVEEYTGTWCGFCPRGIVAMQRLEEQFGDRAIIIAVHGRDSDPMSISSYKERLTGSYPQCQIDRGPIMDPYTGTNQRGNFHYAIDLDFQAALDQPTEAGLELQAQWNDPQQWDVRFTATTTFATDGEQAPYRLAFVLMENGLKGDGSNWAQANYYPTIPDYTDDDMKAWNEGPEKVGNMVYNHVPVNTLGIKSGIDGSITAPIKAMQPQQYTNTVTTLNQKVIQDKQQLYAVALLLNSETGLVVNAAQAPILPYDASGVSSPTAVSTASTAVYDLRGRKVADGPDSRLPKGIYLYGGKKHIVK